MYYRATWTLWGTLGLRSVVLFPLDLCLIAQSLARVWGFGVPKRCGLSKGYTEVYRGYIGDVQGKGPSIQIMRCLALEQ